MATCIMHLHMSAFARTTKVRRHTEILLETYIRFLYYIDCASAAEKINVYTVSCSYHVQVAPSLTNKFSKQGHRLAPGQATSNGNGHVILNDRSCLGRRHPLIF